MRQLCVQEHELLRPPHCAALALDDPGLAGDHAEEERRRPVSKRTEEDDDEWIRPIGGLLEENETDVRCMTSRTCSLGLFIMILKIR
jgi:hypothetical protein